LGRMRRSAAIVSLLMLLVWSLATLLVTLLPGRAIGPEVPNVVAKLGHLVLFGGWALLAGTSIAALRGIQRLNLRLLWVAAVGFGAAIELAQELLPYGREGSLLDVLINAVGVSAACLVLNSLRRRCSKRGARSSTDGGAVVEPELEAEAGSSRLQTSR